MVGRLRRARAAMAWKFAASRPRSLITSRAARRMRALVSAESAAIGRPRPRPMGEGPASLATSKRYGIARTWSTTQRVQTPQRILGYPGIGGQLNRPAIGVGGFRGPPCLGQQMRPRRPGRLKSLDSPVVDRVEGAKPRVGAVDLAVDGRRGDGRAERR